MHVLTAYQGKPASSGPAEDPAGMSPDEAKGADPKLDNGELTALRLSAAQMEVKKAERAADIFLFILPQKELENTPSRKAGVSAEVEAEQRAVGCELIMDTGVLLSLPMICMSRAQVLLHRFFYRRSLTEFDVRAVAVAVLFLATKLEESPTKLRQVILTYQRVALRRAGYESPSADLPSIDVGSGAYFTVKDAIIEVERTALLELSFLMFVEHPHK
eukprot:gene3945-6111_t